MRHRHPPLRNQFDFGAIEPDGMRDHRPWRLEETEIIKRYHRSLAVTGGKFADLDFCLAAMCMKSSIVLLGKINRAALAGLVGIEQMFKSDPYIDAAAGLAIPVLDQSLVHVERVEIVIFGVLAALGNSDQPMADGLGCLAAALHESPHVHLGRGVASRRLRITHTCTS